MISVLIGLTFSKSKIINDIHLYASVSWPILTAVNFVRSSRDPCSHFLHRTFMVFVCEEVTENEVADDINGWFYGRNG